MTKNLAVTFGVVFVLVGLLGYIGGAGIVGPTGFFATDAVHDTVHFLSGLVMLIVAFAAPQSSAGVLKVFGIIYLLVAVFGFFDAGLGGLMTSNAADTWLHLVLGIVITWAGFGTAKSMSAPMSTV